MAYVLEGVMCRGRPSRSTGLLSTSLAENVVLFPIEEVNRSLLVSRFGEGEPMSQTGLLDLTTTIETFARELSAGQRTVYVHAEFHGGTGFHAAVGWINRVVGFGPCLTANHPAERQTDAYEVVPIPEMAINQALRFLGVRPSSGDEFDTVGLGRCRWTSDWLA